MGSRNHNPIARNDVIEILDPNLRLGFAQMPRPVLRASGLSRNAKTLYALLLDYAWQDGSCFPGQARLAADLDISVDTLKRDLDELRRYGLLSWKQRGMNQTNVYYILPLSDCPYLKLKREVESADLPLPESADLRNPDSADTRNQESAGLRRQESAAARRQESAAARNKIDPAALDTAYQTQTTTRRPRAAKTEAAPVVVVPSQPTTVENTLTAQLVSAGMTASVAAKLCARFPAARIAQQLEVLAYLRTNRPGEVNHPAAWLRAAIEQDWAAPHGFKSAAQREAERQARLVSYAQQASMDSLLDAPPPSDPPPSPPTDPLWAATLNRLRSYLPADKLELLARARLLPHQPGDPVARLAVGSAFERSRLQSFDLQYVEFALSEALDESVRVEVVLG